MPVSFLGALEDLHRRYGLAMHGIFQILGVCAASYVVYSFMTGEVYVKSGLWGRTFRRDEEPWKYWGAIIPYSVLAIALIFFFGQRTQAKWLHSFPNPAPLPYSFGF